jgi:hypothetical protein
MLERSLDSGPWPAEWTGAQNVRLKVPAEPPPLQPLQEPRGYRTEAELSISEIQNLSENVAEIQSAAVGINLRFVVRVELGPSSPPSEEELVCLSCSRQQFGYPRPQRPAAGWDPVVLAKWTHLNRMMSRTAVLAQLAPPK